MEAFWAFFLETYLIASGVQMGQQFAVHKVLGVVDDHHHDGLWYHIACGLCNDAHIGIDQITNCLDLPLEQRVQRAARLGLLLLHFVVSFEMAFERNRKLGKGDKAIIFDSYDAQLLHVWQSTANANATR